MTVPQEPQPVDPTVVVTGVAGVPGMDDPSIIPGMVPVDPTLVAPEPVVPEPPAPLAPEPVVVVSPQKSNIGGRLVLVARILVLSPILTYVAFLVKAYSKISSACKPLTFECVYDDTYALQAVTLLQAVLMFLLVVTLSLSGINVHRLVKGKDKMRGKGWIIAVFLALACGGASYAMFML